MIVFDDCDLDNAVTGAMLANFLSQGQVTLSTVPLFIVPMAVLEAIATNIK